MGCRSQATPQAAFDDINNKVSHGDLRGALADLDKLNPRYWSGSPNWNWRFRILKAQILVSQSKPKEALQLLDAELPSSLAGQEVAVRKALYEGMAHRYLQEFAESRKRLAEAERLSNSSFPLLRSQVLNARGALEVDENNYRDAEITFRLALADAKSQNIPLQEASALGNLARVATSQDHFDEAIDLSQLALRQAKSLDSEGLVTTILGNMGWAYFQLGDFENSLKFYKQAEATAQKSALIGYRAYWLTGIANVYLANHNFRDAEAVSQQALAVAKTLEDTETITESLNQLTRIAMEAGRFTLAEKYNSEASALEESGLDHFGTNESRLLTGRIFGAKRNFPAAVEIFKRVMNEPAVETSLKWEAEARLAKLYDDEDLPEQAEKEYQKSINTIEVARSSVSSDESRLTFLASGIEFYEDYVGFLIEHGRELEALKIAELSRARTLAQGLVSTAQARPISAREIRPQVTAQKWKATLLFYWIGQQQSYLWVISPSKTLCVKLPKASEMEPLVKAYREALVGSRDVLESANPDGRKLYDQLVAPAKTLIPSGSRVIVLPDASLYGLNFETLIVSEPKSHYWIEDVTLTTASSLTLLDSATRTTRAARKTLLLVGNTEPPNADFPSLPQAPEEMRQIEQYFPVQDRLVLEGKPATPAAYLQSNPEKFSYLHFVTHGTASHTRPLESAVILSQAGDNFKLYGREIVRHRLQAELVTISACNGSGTRAYSGEGLVGLSWAFLRAGAHNVIGALWEVSDASTPRLMNDLYGGLAAGRDPAAALRAAKLAMLHSRDVYRKPFYWAPFQLYSGS